MELAKELVCQLVFSSEISRFAKIAGISFNKTFNKTFNKNLLWTNITDGKLVIWSAVCATVAHVSHMCTSEFLMSNLGQSSKCFDFGR